MSSLEPFLVQLENAWAAGSRNGAALWRTMKAKGFTGSLRVVSEWATRQRKDEGTASRDNRPGKTPSARSIARMMTTERDTLSKTVARTVAMIGDAVPGLTAARDLLDRFHRIVQHRKDKRLDDWLADAKTGLMGSFASGIEQDCTTVRAALTEPWSNGQTGGAEHETQAGQATDVGPGKSRSASSPPDRATRKFVEICTKIASEPKDDPSHCSKCYWFHWRFCPKVWSRFTPRTGGTDSRKPNWELP